MRAIHFSTIVCALLILSLTVQGQRSRKPSEADLIPISLQFNESELADVPAASQRLLKNKLRQLITKKGMGERGEEARFYLEPSVSLTDKDITPTAPPLVAVILDVNLTIGDRVEKRVFASESVSLKGAGTNETKAFTDAFKRISASNAVISAMIDDGREEILAFYEKQCDRVIAEAETLANVQQFGKAINRLASIPSYLDGCYAKVSKKIEQYYKRDQERDCEKYINLAEDAVALRNYLAAAEALAMIDPETNCYSKANQLKQEISSQTQAEYDKVWEYRDRAQENYVDLIKAKYNAQSQAQGNAADSADVEVASNYIEGEGPSVEETRGIALFKVISPLSRSATGEIRVSGNKVVIHGLVDEPSKAQTLTVDGLVTSWDEDGVFSRSLILTEREQEVQIKLTSANGAVSQQTLYVAQDPSAPKSQQDLAALPKDWKKVALVIGNNDYSSIGALRNAANDAQDMAKALTSLGFEVEEHLNASYEEMRTSILGFSKKVQEANIALFYYSGHGLEVERKNYLVPVDAVIESPDDIKLRCIPTQTMLNVMEYGKNDNLGIVILDACRNNPFPKGSRSGGAGLARITPPSGMVIAYSTEPGSVASDGSGENGLYTGELIRQIKIPQRIEDVFMNTRIEVERKSGETQRPWEEARLKGVFYLNYDN